ncbi:BspA family leucine-rich repeat surface protein [Mycoplasma mycoides]|uniref:BspA family leucine-rich repeat surface protein n=1 Tax=Mycoplasma mycoides subsp. capri TaxID=40477 RepID=A0AB38GF32_MYCMC|nr:BspA family leucine-rich repeat surface protein [Mycoplasma mycoides]ADH21552.1 putative liporotein [synthetic Mycoplasma mycoides JCVI-syn1.0]ACU78410.1 putative liporotein [Mycoplasma mycoides subsp. capri str. GM12]ACU79240.1 putative liporotein [Mycoplasma mycoides subsp. capri str. GM12]SRX59151.1 BspA family leucine-rich repeat surface protein [Mycoplasma mycoides subsp. capri]SRX62285.1 BspA family leucine-rich repeat surface protein [Mycoplasma mycoides subsp. capri]
MLFKVLSFILVSSSALLVVSCSNKNTNNSIKKEIIKKELTAEQKQTINDIFVSQQDAFATFHTYKDVLDQLKVFLSKKNLNEVILFDENQKDKHLVLDNNANKNSVKIRVFGNVFEFKPKTVKEYVETKYSDDTKTKVTQLGYKKETIQNVDYYVLNRLDENTKEVPIDLPSKINSLKESFKSNKNENIQNLEKWDTKNIISFKEMFYEAKKFNQDISSWNVSNVKNMSNMFSAAENFNSTLSNWDVSKVVDMESIFDGASSFNQNLNNWNTKSVKNLTFAFRDAKKFNQPLDKWNVLSVTTMEGMFSDAISFNQDISLWNTSNVDTMNGMFSGAKSFNQNLNNWNVQKVGNAQNFAKDIKNNLPKEKLPKFRWQYSSDDYIYGPKK